PGARLARCGHDQHRPVGHPRGARDDTDPRAPARGDRDRLLDHVHRGAPVAGAQPLANRTPRVVIEPPRGTPRWPGTSLPAGPRTSLTTTTPRSRAHPA